MTDAVATQAPDSPEVGREGAIAARSHPYESQASAYVSLFEQTAQRGDEPEWVGALRRGAIESFRTLGFPTTKNEDWHFTSVAPILRRQYRPDSRTRSAVSSATLAAYELGGEWDTLVFVNGSYVAALSSVQGGAGVSIATLSRALTASDHGHSLDGTLGGLATVHSNAFTALNAAFMQDGAVIRLNGECGRQPTSAPHLRRRRNR